MTTKDRVHLNQARDAARQSQDPSTKVGAVVVFDGGYKAARAHNYFLTIAGEELEQVSREERYADVVHAEVAAILLPGVKASGATLYGTEEPCADCCKTIAAAGIRRVVCHQTDEDRRQRWGCDRGAALLERFGVELVVVPR
jgi:dCMP deaminase